MQVDTVEFYAVGALIGALLLVLAFKGQGSGRNQPGRRGSERGHWSRSADRAGSSGWSPGGDPSTVGSGTTDTGSPPHHSWSHHGSSHHGSSHHGGSSGGSDQGSWWGSDSGPSWGSDSGSSSSSSDNSS